RTFSAGGHEHPRAGTPVRGASDAHDGGQGGGDSLPPRLFVAVQDPSGFAHRHSRYRSFSGVMGSSRRRLPVAWKTALAMAAATPVIGSSPIPRTPSSLK